MAKLTCATWNVHRAKGTDGLVDPDRVMRAISCSIFLHHPDVLALQEADEERRPHGRFLDVARISAESGLVYANDTPALRWGPDSDGFLGTILFLRADIKRTHAHVLDLPGHCHRGAVVIESLCDNRKCRIISTHLSLSQPLRIMQMRTLGQYIRRRPKMQSILLGDLNEWRPWGGLAFSRRVVGTRLTGPAKPSFPTGRPILPLDRIMTDSPGGIDKMTVLDTPETNLASDHRPLIAEVTVA